MDKIKEGLGTDGFVRRHISKPKPLFEAYVLLALFMAIYCCRPEDWLPGLSGVPLAKISGALAFVALICSFAYIRQRLPREVILLGILVGQLFLAAALSPVWRGGALQKTLDFGKILILVMVMIAAVNTSTRLRQIIFIQAASIGVIAGVAVWKGHMLLGRLEGNLGGNYSNSNELALAIVISLPLCLALLFLTRRWIWKTMWALAMLLMLYAVFLTGSRGGFISLVSASIVCLWEFGIVARRRYLFFVVGLAGVILWLYSSELLANRLKGTFDSEEDVASAYGSAQQREGLFWRSLEVTTERPLLGVGIGNFEIISGNWHASHNTFTELSSEGGVPALFLFLAILTSGFRNIRRIKKSARAHRDLILLAQGLNASLAAYVTGAVFANTGYQFFPYFLVTYTTTLLWIAKHSTTQGKQQISLGERTAPENPFGLPQKILTIVS